MGIDADINNNADNISKRKLYHSEWSLELFQRVRFLPAGMMHKGLHWDLGVWGSFGYNNYRLKYSTVSTVADHATTQHRLYNVNPLTDYRWNYGVATRITYDFIGLYGRYRLNGIGQPVPAGKVLLPRLEIGVQLLF